MIINLLQVAENAERAGGVRSEEKVKAEAEAEAKVHQDEGEGHLEGK